MGWDVIPWYTLTDDFDADFDVDEWHGTNVFLRDDDRVFRTYLVDGRGDEALGGLWAYLDVTPLGRQETWEDSPEGYPQESNAEWDRRHDEYEASPEVEAPNVSAFAEQAQRYRSAHPDSSGSRS